MTIADCSAHALCDREALDVESILAVLDVGDSDTSASSSSSVTLNSAIRFRFSAVDKLVAEGCLS